MGKTVPANMENVNVRLPREMVDRLVRLSPSVSSLPEMAMVHTITKSDLIRLAVLRGLRELEAELGAQKQQRLPL